LTIRVASPGGGLPVGCVRTATPAFSTKLGWNPPARAEWYHVFANHPAGHPTGVVLDTYVAGTTKGTGNVTWGTPIAWDVTACHNQGCSPVSPQWSFAGCAPDTLPILKPAPGCVANLRPNISWTPTGDVVTQRLIVTSIADKVRVVDQQFDAYANGYTVPFDLAAGNEYVVQVSTSSGSLSRLRYFRSMCGAGDLPGTVSLEARMGGGDANSWKTPFFIWEEAAAAEQYHLLVTNKTTNMIEVDQTFAASDICGLGQCAVLSPDLNAGVHTWQVQAINAAGAGPWNVKPAAFTVPQKEP
jgi:hypothetical protein